MFASGPRCLGTGDNWIAGLRPGCCLTRGTGRAVHLSGLPDIHHHVPGQARQEATHVSRRNGDTTLGGLITRPREVKKDRTSASTHPRPLVVVEHDDHVINPVVPAEFFMTDGRGQADGPVVGRRARIITPAIAWLDGRALQPEGPAKAPVAAQQDFRESEAAARCGAISLTLVAANPLCSECARECERARLQDAAPW